MRGSAQGERIGSGVLLAGASAASFGLSGALASGLFAAGWSAGAVVIARLTLGALVLAPFAVADLRGRWSAVRRHAGLVAFYGAVPMALAQFAYFSAVSRMAVAPAVGLAGCGLAIAAVALALLAVVGLLPAHATTAAPVYGEVSVPWWSALLALGTVTAAVAYCTGIAAIRRLGSRVASFVALLEVVCGVVWAWLLLSQVPKTLQLAGGALILAGIVVVRLGERAPEPDPDAGAAASAAARLAAPEAVG